ncbi:MAG: ABC transporter substrate-binding protein, partial [Acidimicrobiales bacterium]
SVLVSPSRCASNRAAGTITYLTGFGYEGDVGILDAVAAKAGGLYADECLNVVLQSGNGDPGAAAQLVDSGRVTIAELGSPSDAITDVAGGSSLSAIATYGNVPAITLLTTSAITNLRQLEGKTLGYKGSMPPQITAMLESAGVDVSKIREVGVGYDPTILPRGQVAALTAYKSNEPVQLADDGFKGIREWNPDSYGIKGSFNVLVTSPSFAQAHPSAVEDFLRATFRAYAACASKPAPCIADAARISAGYNSRQNTQEWNLQVSEVASSVLPGKGIGSESVAQWTPEAHLLVADHLIPTAPNLSSIIAPQYVASIEGDGGVSWPGP